MAFYSMHMRDIAYRMFALRVALFYGGKADPWKGEWNEGWERLNAQIRLPNAPDAFIVLTADTISLVNEDVVLDIAPLSRGEAAVEVMRKADLIIMKDAPPSHVFGLNEMLLADAAAMCDNPDVQVVVARLIADPISSSAMVDFTNVCLTVPGTQGLAEARYPRRPWQQSKATKVPYDEETSRWHHRMNVDRLRLVADGVSDQERAAAKAREPVPERKSGLLMGLFRRRSSTHLGSDGQEPVAVIVHGESGGTTISFDGDEFRDTAFDAERRCGDVVREWRVRKGAPTIGQPVVVVEAMGVGNASSYGVGATQGERDDPSNQCRRLQDAVSMARSRMAASSSKAAAAPTRPRTAAPAP